MERPETEFAVRTDLALEARERLPQGGEIEGVSLREWREAGSRLKLTEVCVLNGRGAKAMGKPVGTYLTLEFDRRREACAKERAAAAGELAVHLRKRLAALLGHGGNLPEGCRILAAGLGNPGVTADALGPRTVARLQVTRRLSGDLKPAGLTAIAPGVAAQTGMETAEILRGIIRETHPDAVIAVDALAAGSVRRLGNTIQLSDTGIRPGSGVGSRRCGLTRESLGVPVLAVGVPTVVGCAALVRDTLRALAETQPQAFGAAGGRLSEREAAKRFSLVGKALGPELAGLYVTPTDIDETVSRLGDILSEAIGIALFG